MLINARHLDAHGVSGNLFDFCIYEHGKSFVRRQEMAYGSILQKIMFLAYSFITRTMGRVAPHFVENRRRIEKSNGSMGNGDF